MWKKYFVNEGRLRAGWRILAFLVLFMGINLLAQAILKAAYGGIPRTTEYLRTSIVIALAALAATIAVPLARKYLDKKNVRSLGLPLSARTGKDLVFGFLLSGLMAGAVFLVMMGAGLIEVTGLSWGGDTPAGSDLGTVAAYLAVASVGSLAFLFLIDVVVGWWEELVFRGYLLQNMIDGMGLWIAVAISCVLYGLIHMANPNAGLLSGAIIVLFGFLRIYGYLATKMLWLSMGMHIGWNFFQGPIFGYAASGHQTASLIAQSPTGPAWLSGGDFGPEGSVLIIPVLGLALLAMRWWAKREGDAADTMDNTTPQDTSADLVAT